MLRYNLSKIFRSAFVGAVGGFLAPIGHAANWCPTSSDYQITCSNCSRELTCDVNGISLEIYGTNVTLDGQGYAISDAPYSGILVLNDGVTIKNMSINDPSEYGIYFLSSPDSWDWGYVNNVFVTGAYFYAIGHNTYSPVEISNSWAYNSLVGVAGSTHRFTDFIGSSSAQGNSGDGYSAAGSGSWVRNSYFWNNPGGSGVNVSYAPNTWVDNNAFSSNNGTGLKIYESDGATISNNSGSGAYGYDCVHSSSSNTSAYGNSWGSYSGSGCVQ